MDRREPLAVCKMLLNRIRLSTLFAALVTALALASAPASANTEFDYNLVPSSGTATGTLEIVLAGSGPYATFTNLKSDIVSLKFIIDGQTFDLTHTGSVSFVDFQFDTGGKNIRDLTYAGTTTGRFNLQTTFDWVFVNLNNNNRTIGNYVFVSEETVPVPEPSSLWLMLSGLAALALGLAFRNRSVATWAGFAPNQ